MYRITALLLLLSVAFLGAPAAVGQPRGAGAQAEQLAVIVAARSRVSGVSTAELNRVFRGGLTRNEDGDRFMPLNQPAGSPYRDAFDRHVLGMSSDQVQAFWIDQKIRGAAAEPRTVNSINLAVKFVGAFPGAISYVPVSAVGPEVKALRVDGKLPGEPGYPLR
jgi:hypothetical protein